MAWGYATHSRAAQLTQRVVWRRSHQGLMSASAYFALFHAELDGVSSCSASSKDP
jgi:hypothetical protein